MGMRIVWGMYDTEREILEVLFEAENLLVNHRESLLRKWYDNMTKPLPTDRIFSDSDTDQLLKDVLDQETSFREELLGLGYERWRNDEINKALPRYQTVRYELWNSVPPNIERLVMHFDS